MPNVIAIDASKAGESVTVASLCTAQLRVVYVEFTTNAHPIAHRTFDKAAALKLADALIAHANHLDEEVPQ